MEGGWGGTKEKIENDNKGKGKKGPKKKRGKKAGQSPKKLKKVLSNTKQQKKNPYIKSYSRVLDPWS